MTTAGIYLNVVTGVFNSSPALAPGWDVNPWNITTLNFFTPTPNPGGGEMVGTGTTYFNVGPSFVIGPGSTYANPGSTTINPGTPLIIFSDANYVGFRFINEAAGGQIQYGWLQISLSGSAGRSRAQLFPTLTRIQVSRFSAHLSRSLQLYRCLRSWRRAASACAPGGNAGMLRNNRNDVAPRRAIVESKMIAFFSATRPRVR